MLQFGFNQPIKEGLIPTRLERIDLLSGGRKVVFQQGDRAAQRPSVAAGVAGFPLVAQQVVVAVAVAQFRLLVPVPHPHRLHGPAVGGVELAGALHLPCKAAQPISGFGLRVRHLRNIVLVGHRHLHLRMVLHRMAPVALHLVGFPKDQHRAGVFLLLRFGRH